MSNAILNTDLKHCDLDLAEQILKDYEEDTRRYLNDNKDVYDDFCNIQITSDCNITEYIYMYQWENYINYLRDKYNK